MYVWHGYTLKERKREREREREGKRGQKEERDRERRDEGEKEKRDYVVRGQNIKLLNFSVILASILVHPTSWMLLLCVLWCWVIDELPSNVHILGCAF